MDGQKERFEGKPKINLRQNTDAYKQFSLK